MESCPPELHAYMFQFICDSDAGRTIRSLSRVSAYFQQVARDFLYQSIILSRHQQIVGLTRRLQTLPPLHRRNVRHLCIASTDGCGGSKAANFAQASAAADLIHQLVALVAPSLETLVLAPSLQAAAPSLIGRIFRLRFSRLKELTISGFYPFPSTPESFPSLTHLHLHGNRNPHGLVSTGGLAVACPKLAYLRVSGLSAATSFIAELEKALVRAGECDDDDDDGEEYGEVPLVLREMHLQLDPIPAVSSKIIQAKDALLVETLEGLRQGATTNGVSVVVHERGLVNGDLLRTQWRGRLKEECGAWTPSRTGS